MCNAVLALPPSPTVRGQQRFGGRDVALAFIADALSQAAQASRPLIDKTGLTGPYDFLFEYLMDLPQPGRAAT